MLNDTYILCGTVVLSMSSAGPIYLTLPTKDTSGIKSKFWMYNTDNFEAEHFLVNIINTVTFAFNVHPWDKEKMDG